MFLKEEPLSNAEWLDQQSESRSSGGKKKAGLAGTGRRGGGKRARLGGGGSTAKKVRRGDGKKNRSSGGTADDADSSWVKAEPLTETCAPHEEEEASSTQFTNLKVHRTLAYQQPGLRSRPEPV